MKIIHSNTDEARSTNDAVRASTSRYEDFEAVLWELVVSGAMTLAVHLHLYGTETR